MSPKERSRFDVGYDVPYPEAQQAPIRHLRSGL
jgi:hypothetical protein